MLGLTPHYQPSIAATVPRFGTLVHRAMLYCAYPSIMSHAVQAYVKIYPPRYALVRWSTEHSFIVLIHLSCHKQYKRMSKFILLVSEKEKKMAAVASLQKYTEYTRPYECCVWDVVSSGAGLIACCFQRGTDISVLADKSRYFLQGQVGVAFWQGSLFLSTLPSNGVAVRANFLCFGVVNLSWCYLGGVSVASACNR